MSVVQFAKYKTDKAARMQAAVKELIRVAKANIREVWPAMTEPEIHAYLRDVIMPLILKRNRR